MAASPEFLCAVPRADISIPAPEIIYTQDRATMIKSASRTMTLSLLSAVSIAVAIIVLAQF
jgi:cytochrome bd-type quinol oxidase subunit 2